MVVELSSDLRDNYKIDRQRPHREEWPPNQPSSIVNLALIHYKSTLIQQELNENYDRCKEGASYVSKLMGFHSNITTDIRKLFTPDVVTNLPKRILIEGAPGIGKTVLAKEIAYKWANGEILNEYKLMFLLYLRDPRLHSVMSINELLQLFTSEDTPDLQKYVKKFGGANVAFVFDGFDEYPVALQENSFIADLVKGVRDGEMFFNSAVIITSRPTATLFLHNIVDRRIEILGFPREERDRYISFSLGESLDKKHDLEKYLKQHPMIDNLCYIPLYLAILVYLSQQDGLPETLTEMNESFIINTIYRCLERNKLSPPGVVKKLTDFPTYIVKFIYKLAQLAFKGLQDNQLVFTIDEIREACPEVDTIPGAINGYGLLQAVQHYPKRGAGRTTSVNFLHFTMQEYLAALHVSTLCIDEQLILMKWMFWDGQFNFMWMMYVGIVGVKSETFTSFIGSDSSHRRGISDIVNMYNDKRKCLLLFQCYMEAKSDKIPKAISSMFTNGEITLTNTTLLPHHISSLIFFMFASSVKQWKILELNDCNLGDTGMDSLFEHVIKNDENISTLEYVDLSGNNSSPWGVYCAIIRHCCVDSLTLCGDEEMKEYVNEITDSLETNPTLQSLTLCKIGRIGVQSIRGVLDDNTTLKELNMSWNCKGTVIIHRQLIYDKFIKSSSNSYEGIVNINILYDSDHECSSEAVNMSNEDINDDAVYLITFGLYNNTTVQKLDLSCNNITDHGATVISNYLKYNNTLKVLNLSHNYISSKGMISLSKHIRQSVSLEYVDLSGNFSFPWGVYCAIIRHSHVTSLTLCGDKGIKYYFMNIIDSLKTNMTLHSLTLCASTSGVVKGDYYKRPQNSLIIEGKLNFLHHSNDWKVKNNRVVNIKILYDGLNECFPETVSLSHSDIDDDAVCLIAFGLCNNTAVKEIDLLGNKISMNGMIRLSECLKYTTSLEFVDLSGNKSSPWGVYCAIIEHCCVNSLTLCGDKGMNEYVKEFTDSLQTNTTLQSLTLCNIESDAGMLIVNNLLINNTTLKEFNLSWSNKGTNIVCRNLRFDKKRKITLTECPRPFTLFKKDVNDLIICLLCGLYKTTVQILEISQNRITDDGTICISDFLQHDSGILKELDLSHNQISRRGMNNLSECIQHAIPLEYVDLSENNSSQWGVYCAIIRHCCVNRLTLCGDEGMGEYVKEIVDSLETNKMLRSLTLCTIGRTGLQSTKNILDNNTTLQELNMTWKSKGTIIIHRRLVQNEFNSSNGYERVVDINILYDSDHKCSSEVINMSNEDINDDAVCLITFGLCNNTTVQKLDLSCNRITDDGVVAIVECLKTNNTIQELNLSCNRITSKGAKQMAEVIRVNKHLRKFDMSENPIGDDGMMYISDSLKQNNTLLELNLSSTGITDEVVEAITEAIEINVALENLDLSQNYISDNGMIVIHDHFRKSNTLRELHWV